jgi:UDP-glucuronate 4-epimerase
MKVLVTGAAGFIGFHLCQRLLCEGHEVIGVDNLNDYYDPALKQARLDRLGGLFTFRHEDIRTAKIEAPVVIHLAAQAGVRYSIENPQAYIDANVTGFQSVLNQCKEAEHVIYASSSSVYGMKSTYAVTKMTNEGQAYAHHSLYGVPMTGLRFFTVYGPYGRPDMSMLKFAKAMLDGEPIELFNNGEHWRSFTYVDDIVEGIVRVLDNPRPGAAVYDLGNQDSVSLKEMVANLSRALEIEPEVSLLPMQPGDSEKTQSHMKLFFDRYGEWEFTSIRDGAERFVDWYRGYYK